mmetsp:Transcript_16167/g.39090  ORF Transcript_16167/g.39090 Transcript_16167/m.39090 type:complete len:238 (+) Transcript_16167:383-1096(+)
MLVTVPFLTLMPKCFSPLVWSALNLVTMLIGFNPAFSAKVKGMTSKACAYSLTTMLSSPFKVRAQAANFTASSISGAPPPGIIALFFTRERTTHRASWMDRSVSSSTMRLEPRTRIDTPGYCRFCFNPVKRMMDPSPDPRFCSVTKSADPSFSLVKLSRTVTGSQPSMRDTKSISSRSTSRTTKIFALAQKSRDRSVTASLRIDFWISSTLHPVAAICLIILAMISRSSRRIRSMAV